jgi:hypothetical protein
MSEKKSKHIVLGVHITDRVKHVPDVQALFTEYGCNIRTRIGLHVADGKVCSPNGVIVLEMTDDEEAAMGLAEKLRATEGVEVQSMIFDHP